MNKKEYQRRRKWLDLIDKNGVRYGAINELSKTYSHDRAVFEIVRSVKNTGLLPLRFGFSPDGILMEKFERVEYSDFLTEVFSKDRKRKADILIFTDDIPIIVEVGVSESDESLEKKSKSFLRARKRSREIDRFSACLSCG